MKRLATTLTTLVMGAAAVGVAAPANASPAHPLPTFGQESEIDGFLDALRARGIYVEGGGDAALLRGGFTVCQALDAGMTPTAVGLKIYEASDLSAKSSGVVVGAAVNWLCPEHSDAIRRVSTTV